VNKYKKKLGLLVGKIHDDFPFNGYYKDAKKTEDKILRNLFKKGDAYFNTGDMLKMAKDFTLRFSDRVGDTYRWKGENVSTLEVSNTLGENIPWIKGIFFKI
jgi:acyl-CoA synthetase (AMP-forming)/AMP-acid ligase II